MTAPREMGRFVRGHRYSPETMIAKGERLSPATEIKPGQHLSLRTEFKKGQAAHNKLPVGSVTMRKHNRAIRAFVKIAEPNVWRERAKVVWEEANGRRLPRGYVVHHIDRNPLNDDIGNLVALTRADHVREHHWELIAAKRSGRSITRNAA